MAPKARLRTIPAASASARWAGPGNAFWPALSGPALVSSKIPLATAAARNVSATLPASAMAIARY